MSGTSLDGVDGVLVDFAPPGEQQRPRVLGYAAQALPMALRQELLALNTPADNELHRAALAANALVRVYAAVVQTLLVQCGVAARQVRAIGAHGQTVRHRPQAFDGIGYTLQLNQPALLAELCGIDVVADFRSRDVAAGGQGAPLVPPFHHAFFGTAEHTRAVLNIGGISNITVLHADATQSVQGFDCGPGNALMDAWCMAHTGAAFDDAGAWAATGTVHRGLLARLQSEPFFSQAPPKSTGRDMFHMPWLQSHLADFPALPAQDVQATLTELTAQCCAQSVLQFAAQCHSVVVCGGGAFNAHLMQRMADLLAPCAVLSSEALGLPPLQVEAAAFAWLAQQTVLGQPASLAAVTGARGSRRLGAIYPA